MDKSWYETVGKEHLRSFAAMIENGYAIGKVRGLKMTRTPDVAEMMEIYRGRGPGRYKLNMQEGDEEIGNRTLE